MPLRRLFFPAVLLALSACAGLLRGDGVADDPEQLAIVLARIVDSPNTSVLVRIDACDGLKKLGPRAAIAAPALAGALRFEEPIRTHAAEALVAIGPGAIPALRLAMKTGDSIVIATAAGAWAAIDSKQGVGFVVLLDRLVKGEPIERYEAAVVLVRAAFDPLSTRKEDALVPSKYLLTWGHLDELMRTAEAGSHDERYAALVELAAYQLSLPDVARRVRKLLDDPAADIAQGAANALATMRDAAIPQFLDAMRSRDGYTRRLAVTAWADPYLNVYRNRKTLIKEVAQALDDPDPLIRRAGAATLYALWPESEPILTRAMKRGDDAVKEGVVEQILVVAGKRYVQIMRTHDDVHAFPTPPIDETFAEFEAQVSVELLRRMESSRKFESDCAFEAIRGFRSSASRNQLVEPLMRAMEDATAVADKLEITRKLILLKTETVPVWMIGARSKDSFTREWCVRALADRAESKTDGKIIAVMTTALGDPRTAIRHEALKWASYFAQPPPGAAEKLAGWLTPGNELFNEDAADRSGAAQLLGEWAVEPRTSVPALTLALDDTHAQLAAVFALRKFGADAKPAVPQLAALLKSNSDELRQAAVDTLLALGPEGRGAAVRGLIDVLRGPGDDVRAQVAAAVALRKFGTDAKPAVPQLAALFKSNSDELRQAATDTLLGLCPEGRSAAVGYLIDVLRGRRDDVSRLWAVRGLAAAGHQAAAAAADLTTMLADSPKELRLEVARALGEIGPDAGPAFATLTRMVDNTNPEVRQAASEALLKIAPTGKGLGPALMAAVLNRDRVCVESLATALQRSGEAQTYLARLTDLAANDPDAVVRATARRATDLLSRKSAPH